MAKVQPTNQSHKVLIFQGKTAGLETYAMESTTDDNDTFYHHALPRTRAWFCQCVKWHFWWFALTDWCLTALSAHTGYTAP